MPHREPTVARTTEPVVGHPSRYDDHQITAWAVAAGQGDPQALAAFVRSTQDDVWRFLHYLLDLPSTEALTREAYRRAVRALPRFADGSSARTWLLGVARGLAAEHDAADVRPSRPGRRAATGVGTGYEADLRRMVGQLRQERREAFVATQLLGLSYVEAALVCGCPVAAIRTRVALARDDLVAMAQAGREPAG